LFRSLKTWLDSQKGDMYGFWNDYDERDLCTIGSQYRHNCLWGKHVDEAIPGDRASQCQGLMKPVASEYKEDRFRIFYKCQKCNHQFWVKAAENTKNKNDNREILMELLKNSYR
jgi:hypothetical protein